tara:strand:- start:288 stop:608 length:321 start_codon:yes stop_codon:yes gene_type:complete
MTVVYKILDNGVVRDMTDAEKAEVDSLQKPIDWAARKLAEIRKIRNRKLSETDYLGASDQTMSDAMKTRRQEWRDIPANHTDEAAYDLLLARDASGNLTHSVWSKP